MKPLARYAALANYVELTRGFGGDPVASMRSVGLDPGSVELQDRWIPADAVATLLDRTARETGHDDLGLRLGELRRLSNLGPLSLVIREEPDVRSALRMLIRYEHLYNQALRTRLTEADGIATVRVTFELDPRVPSVQATDLAVSVVHRLFVDLLGPTWSALSVCFSHPAPATMHTVGRMFGGTARFSHSFDGIILYADDLDRPNAMSDPNLRTYARRVLDTVSDDSALSSTDLVRGQIELLLPTGRCSVDQVARSLGVDRRTVHRRLANEDTTFSGLLDDVRADLARQLVRSRRYPLSEVAEMVGFASPSNFTRWFRRRFGTTPRHWRDTGGTDS